MMGFQGFKTKEDAKKFQKKRGGTLTWDKRNTKTDQPIGVGIYYGMAVHFGGLDKKQYPYCVMWGEG